MRVSSTQDPSMLGIIVFTISLVVVTFAKPQLVIVDDQYGDMVTGVLPTFRAPVTGKVWNQGATCQYCAASRFDASNPLIMNGTWHDATGGSEGLYSVDVLFTGYTVDVYFILAGNNLGNSIVSSTNLAIFLDNVQVAAFTHDSSLYTDYQYNQSIYSNASLTNADHTISIRSTGVQSLFLFDYLTYMKDSDTVVSSPRSTSASPNPTSTLSNSNSQEHSNIAAIAGGAAGGICALVALVVMTILCMRRRKPRPLAIGVEDNKSFLSRFRCSMPPSQGRRSLQVDLIGTAPPPPSFQPQPHPGSTIAASPSSSQHKTNLYPQFPPGGGEPYAYSAASDTFQDLEDQRLHINQARSELQDQVRVLLDEVARLRMQDQPITLYVSSERTPSVTPPPPPPDYVATSQTDACQRQPENEKYR